MSYKFSLWLLNDEYLDKHPRSWICISGEKVKNIVSKIEKGIIIDKKTNREQISRSIAKSLSINLVSIKNLFRGKNRFYPIPFLLELCNLSKNNKYYIKRLESSIEYLKVNSASSKPHKASKKLSKNFAKIIGAFCADGSLSMQFIISSKNKEELDVLQLGFVLNKVIKQSLLRKEFYIVIQVNKNNYGEILRFSHNNNCFQNQTHYTIELTDEYQTNVEAFNTWIKKELGISPYSFKNKKNAWRTAFSSKIFARYLIKYFGMLPGYKTTTVEEPKIIKNSPLKIRKEFAKGVLMFDGCITKRKILSFSSLSPHLADSIKDILSRDKIEVGSFTNKRGERVVYTLSKNKISKLLSYFEEGTKKWDLLRWLDNANFKSEQITYEGDLPQAKEILQLLKKVKICDVDFLKKQMKYSHTTVRQHLLNLNFKGLIKLSNKPKEINDYVSDNTTIFLQPAFHNYLFNKILEKFKSYEEFSKFLEIHKATLSAWKVRKNRISLKIAKEICKNLEIPYSHVLSNIYETDREIAEII